jgi:hypothetical protein
MTIKIITLTKITVRIALTKIKILKAINSIILILRETINEYINDFKNLFILIYFCIS